MLIARNIKKSFGKKRVLDDIDITLENGKITTIIGENGAGKSTIIGIISGFFFQDTGTVQKSTVSVMPDADSLFEDMTGKQFLKYILEIKKVDYKKAVTMAETFGIKKALNKKMCEYSFGMKKRSALFKLI
ncbi:ATP-binding cassette domain-containing protein [Ligilactobacillus sp. WILCCON 0076]|uniref:ATP-binding cassette domain-containing protein n=1 Tax=Ligilactobacillus ubinensis TaxID=2876789 RepID=A0A9X2FNR8_9LACO|nr:ATP-binding cassette domain-containing protein [Ligilactobacillus ubinensis]MCP0887378.1 ATP-binding cassette domain-containing protein [Ligilactobacillus ubinensis]